MKKLIMLLSTVFLVGCGTSEAIVADDTIKLRYSTLDTVDQIGGKEVVFTAYFTCGDTSHTIRTSYMLGEPDIITGSTHDIPICEGGKVDIAKDGWVSEIY